MEPSHCHICGRPLTDAEYVLCSACETCAIDAGDNQDEDVNINDDDPYDNEP